MTFNRAITITGSPRVGVTVGAATRYFTYLSGSGTATINFRYTVGVGDYDTDGIEYITPMDMNGGSMRDSTGQDANVTFAPPSGAGVLVDGINVTVASITPPADDNYITGQNLDFIVNFSYPAVVTGTPRLQLTVGATTRYANYVSGSGTAAHTYRYTLIAGELDTNGVATVGPIVQLNGGTINDPFAQAATSLAFTAQTYAGVLVDSSAPTISSVTGPSAATYLIGQNLNFTVNTSEAVIVTGTPRVQLTIGATTRYANYVSGSGSAALTFSYTVAAGDFDNNGIASVSPLQLNSGTILDLSGNAMSVLTFTPPNTTAVNVSAAAPTITSVTAPANATYKTTNNLNFTVNFNANVTITGSPRIPITLASGTEYATYLSGSGTSAIIFRYTVAVDDQDGNGIAMVAPLDLNGGTIRDSSSSVNASLTYTPPVTTGVLVDGITVTIASITPPADGTYDSGSTLDFTVTYNYPATVTGTPRIQLTVGAATAYATYVSGSTTTTHVFRYTVAVNDLDTNGIDTVGPIQLNGGTIRDAFADNATLTFTGTNYPNKRIDGVRPTVSTMIASANKTYLLNETITFTATYSEVVNVSGTPRLTLIVGAATRYATYTSGTGTNTLTFSYQVPLNDLDTNGIAASNTIDLNGGGITDVPGNAQTPLTYTVPNLTLVRVDAVVPVINSITAPATAYYGSGAALNFTVVFSEAVTVTGSPSLDLNVGGAVRNAVYVSGSGTTNIIFRYTTVAGDNDTNGVATENPLLLNSGTIRDASLNNAFLTFTDATYAGVQVDALAPVVSSVSLPANNTYKNGSARPALSFTVNYNETVTVTGTPRINMTVGSTVRYATYVSGSGSTALVFSYNVATSDLDLNGIAIGNGNNLELNGGVIRDARFNNANLAMGSLVTNRIFTVLPSMASWYDVSDTTKIVLTGSNVTALNDKIGTTNLTHAGAAYFATGFNGGTNAYVTCTNAVGFSSPTMNSPLAIVSIYRAPTSTANQFLYYLGNTGRPMVQFSSTATGGTVLFGVNGSKYSAGTWSGTAGSATNLWTSGAVAARGFSWTSSQSRTNRLCRMNGQLAETILFTTIPSAAEMAQIQTYINGRYGLNFP